METLLVNTDIPCTARQIPYRRKEIVDQVLDIFGKVEERHTLFHNHTEKGVIRRYPRVHYRSHNGLLVLFVWGEAVDITKRLIMMADPDNIKHKLHINNTSMKLVKENFTKSDKNQYYRLMDWVPMNNDAYNKWKKSFTMKERLEILDFAIDINLKILASVFMSNEEAQKVSGELFMINEIKSQTVFENKVIGANVIFRTKYNLPKNFALGRNVSIGTGTYKKLINNPEK